MELYTTTPLRMLGSRMEASDFGLPRQTVNIRSVKLAGAHLTLETTRTLERLSRELCAFCNWRKCCTCCQLVSIPELVFVFVVYAAGLAVTR